MALRNTDIIDLIEHGSSGLLRPIPPYSALFRPMGIEIHGPSLRREAHKQAMFYVSMVMSPIVVHSYDVRTRQYSPNSFMGMLAQRYFARIAEAYKFMIERGGMKSVCCEDVRRDGDYLDGFVA